jgi:hypothetical protein
MNDRCGKRRQFSYAPHKPPNVPFPLREREEK